MNRAPLTAVVLTFNEERNLGACLDGLAGWVDQIVVVDSGSTDRTIDIATARGADVFTHAFESHARQWQWALAQPLRHAWVLGLDADQQVTPELRDSIVQALRAPGDTVGYYLNRRQIFRGRWIRHGGYYPKYLLKLFRRDAVSIDDQDRVDHHFHVAGETRRLAGDLIEDNRNEASIAAWIAKHNRYARLQAEEELRRGAGAGAAAVFGTPDDRVRLRKRIWSRLPLFVRPCMYFFYRYVVRLGFLDGKEGFVFHFMQALWYRLLVDINRDELTRTAPASDGVAPEAALDTRRTS